MRKTYFYKLIKNYIVMTESRSGSVFEVLDGRAVASGGQGGNCPPKASRQIF